jgi:predicted transcriptional regulator
MARRTVSVSESLRAAISAAARAGVTRYRIAKETGIEQSALSRFVRRKVGLDLSSVDLLAQYLGLELVQTKELDRKAR